tara:strand:- start:52 stop:471 length:420 start_codon:yes stop_codon:yes gene_type:complete
MARNRKAKPLSSSATESKAMTGGNTAGTPESAFNNATTEEAPPGYYSSIQDESPRPPLRVDFFWKVVGAILAIGTSVLSLVWFHWTVNSTQDQIKSEVETVQSNQKDILKELEELRVILLQNQKIQEILLQRPEGNIKQ